MKKFKTDGYTILEFVPTLKSRNKNKFYACEGRQKDEIRYKVPGQEFNSVGYDIQSMLYGHHSVEDGCYKINKIESKHGVISVGENVTLISSNGFIPAPCNVNIESFEVNKLGELKINYRCYAGAGYTYNGGVVKRPSARVVIVGGAGISHHGILDMLLQEKTRELAAKIDKKIADAAIAPFSNSFNASMLFGTPDMNQYRKNAFEFLKEFENNAVERSKPFWERIKFQIFLSADGHPMHEGDTYYHVTSNYEVQEEKVVASQSAMIEYQSSSKRRFKDKGKAYEYRNSFSVFKTEDSVMIFPRMKYWTVRIKETKESSTMGLKLFEVNGPYTAAGGTYPGIRNSVVKAFSNKKVAEEFVMLKKPIFTFEDVFAVLMGRSELQYVRNLENEAKKRCGLNVINNQDQCMKRSDQMSA